MKTDKKKSKKDFTKGIPTNVYEALERVNDNKPNPILGWRTGEVKKHLKECIKEYIKKGSKVSVREDEEYVYLKITNAVDFTDSDITKIKNRVNKQYQKRNKKLKK